MAFLVVAGVTVGAAKDSVRRTVTEIGDGGRMFDGTWRQNVRNRVSGWAGETHALKSSQASTQFAALTSSTQPVECWGDMLGSPTSSSAANFFTKAVTEQPIIVASTFRQIISWEIQASS